VLDQPHGQRAIAILQVEVLHRRRRASGSDFEDRSVADTPTVGRGPVEASIAGLNQPLSINPQFRGFFDVAGQFQGPDLVMNWANEQGIRFNTGPFIDSATVTLRWREREEFEAACRSSGNER
jgi:hypothetical protein